MSRKRVLIVLGFATVALDAVVLALDHWISKAGGPGILGLELAGSSAKAQRIMGEWGPDGRADARLSLWIDYAFLLCYGAFFTLAGLTVRDWSRVQGRRWMAALGVFVPWFAAAAAVFDACEDVLLLLVLAGHGGHAAPVVATVFASLKFALITTAIAYVLVGALFWVRSRVRGHERAPAGRGSWRARRVVRTAAHVLLLVRPRSPRSPGRERRSLG